MKVFTVVVVGEDGYPNSVSTFKTAADATREHTMIGSSLSFGKNRRGSFGSLFSAAKSGP